MYEKLEMTTEKVKMAESIYYPDTCLDGLWKTKICVTISDNPDQILNRHLTIQDKNFSATLASSQKPLVCLTSVRKSSD
jgi:hypothetical protein